MKLKDKLKQKEKQYNKLLKQSRLTKEELLEKNRTLDKKIDDLTDANSNKIGAIFLITILFISSWMIIPNLGKNIDEDDFCLKKLNNHFPEYNFESAKYLGLQSLLSEDYKSYTCQGKYLNINENAITKDGLREIDVSRETQVKFFKLIDQEDIDYLESDNSPNFILFLGIVLVIIGLIIFWSIWMTDYY